MKSKVVYNDIRMQFQLKVIYFVLALETIAILVIDAGGWRKALGLALVATVFYAVKRGWGRA